MTLLSVQPFGICDPGGGPRILRALLADPPRPVLSVSTSPRPTAQCDGFSQTHIPIRQQRRLDATRWAHWLGFLDLLALRRLHDRLVQTCVSNRVECVHVVAHGVDLVAAAAAARTLNLPTVLSVHDDVRYVLKGPPQRTALSGLAQLWKDAEERLVITAALGEEYCERYGSRPFTVVTDGVDGDLPLVSRRQVDGLRIYFAGLFHRAYIPNFNSLFEAIEGFRTQGPKSVTCRCGAIPDEVRRRGVRTLVAPFAPEAQVVADLEESNILYLPLPFGERYQDFGRLSLSTKLITYVASGRPILYHGPSDTAAFHLLQRSRAAALATDPNPGAIARALSEIRDRGGEFVENALALADREFRVETQRDRFWSAIDASLAGMRGAHHPSGASAR
jgi:Glycosyltransferase Family 4